MTPHITDELADKLKEHDVVVLLQSTPTTHFESGEPITITQGSVGTIVDDYIGETALVEFADADGCAVAIDAIPVEHLMLLVHQMSAATA
ncbi:MAG: DUF4926 domain-containing protein [Candidatus Kapaibacterium sp.]|nr:MAG: DUF4926 domain-containing protein [Candidatus Kapabacteria bacterium]